nr:FtsK/SpoIIIE domain-containing protein [Kineosporia babensis]
MNRPVSETDQFRELLTEAEDQVHAVQSGLERSPDVLVIVAAALPANCTRADLARISALAHAGPAARVHLLLAGYPSLSRSSWETGLENTTLISTDQSSRGHFRISDPPGSSFGADGRGLNATVTLDPPPPAGLIEELCRQLVAKAESDSALSFDALVPKQLWQGSSVDGLRTTVGRVGRGEATVSLDDATPHWLVAGRTGSGKTVFLLDVLYGLAARYSPDELSLYLLDFKEGVSFADFMPSANDPTWVPHARTVGVESDREYGVAVLADLVREMGRRAGEMKRAGVTSLSALRSARADVAMPRIVTVIDEFHVLFQGNDDTAKRAVALLEEVARKGRSYGIHLIMASQSISGIEALFTKGTSIFGQFGMRVALSGGGGILGLNNDAAAALPTGQVILNHGAGVVSANRRARFPFADPASLHTLRHRMWDMRTPGTPEPAVFIGYAEYSVDEAPLPVRRGRRKVVAVGRQVDVGLHTAGFALDSSPGRHLGVLGTSLVGADVLTSAAISLAKQHEPGTATFHLISLVGTAEDTVEELRTRLRGQGHEVSMPNLTQYKELLQKLAAGASADRDHPQYLFVYGADAASSTLKQKEGRSRAAIEDFRTVLREGPGWGVHVFGWWRGVRRLSDDLGLSGKDDVAGIVALNVKGNEVGSLIGRVHLQWQPRHNRALFIDRHEDKDDLIVPFVTPGRYSEEFA